MFALGMRVAAGLIFLPLIGGALACAQGAVSFKGKTVTMLVGSEAGGGTDAVGRLIALYLRRYLPGEPNVVVQNMSGASGIAALNYFVRRTEPDGLTVTMGSVSTIDPVVFRNANSQYDPKSFRYVGGIGRGGSVIFVRRGAEARLYDKSAKPVMIASVQAMPRPAIQPVIWCIAYLGWNAGWVAGYRGTNETMFAFDRGEVDMTSTGNIFDIKERLDSGRLKVVMQTGALQNGAIAGRPEFGAAPLFPDMIKGRITDPVAQKAFRLWTALNSGDKWLALAPRTGDAVLAAYRDAFDKVAADPDFLAQGEKISDGFAPMPAHDVETVVETLADTPNEAVEYTKGLMRKQGLAIQ